MSIVKRFASKVCLAVVIILGPAALADAAIIQYRATNLADVIAGEDLWMYEYFVSGFVFDVDQGFSTYFDPTLYTNLQSPPPSGSPDWDIIAVQPDPALPSDGFYDALALVQAPSLATPFALTFAWLGGPGTAPGSQAFTINQFDLAGNISFLQTGQTIPLTVPEPSTLLLGGSGFVLAYLVRRRRS